MLVIDVAILRQLHEDVDEEHGVESLRLYTACDGIPENQTKQ